MNSSCFRLKKAPRVTPLSTSHMAIPPQISTAFFLDFPSWLFSRKFTVAFCVRSVNSACRLPCPLFTYPKAEFSPPILYALSKIGLWRLRDPLVRRANVVSGSVSRSTYKTNACVPSRVSMKISWGLLSICLLVCLSQSDGRRCWAIALTPLTPWQQNILCDKIVSCDFLARTEYRKPHWSESSLSGVKDSKKQLNALLVSWVQSYNRNPDVSYLNILSGATISSIVAWQWWHIVWSCESEMFREHSKTGCHRWAVRRLGRIWETSIFARNMSSWWMLEIIEEILPTNLIHLPFLHCWLRGPHSEDCRKQHWLMQTVVLCYFCRIIPRAWSYILVTRGPELLLWYDLCCFNHHCENEAMWMCQSVATFFGIIDNVFIFSWCRLDHMRRRELLSRSMF